MLENQCILIESLEARHLTKNNSKSNEILAVDFQKVFSPSKNGVGNALF